MKQATIDSLLKPKKRTMTLNATKLTMYVALMVMKRNREILKL